MAAGEARPIIVKKVVKVGGGGHHGGAWKVAYADFVTAMMAFFLLMWLLNATTEKQRKGLADYFDPSVPISPISAGGAGVMQGDSFLVPGDRPGTQDQGVRPDTPMPRRNGPGEDRAEGDADAAETDGRPDGPAIAALREAEAAEMAEQARFERLAGEMRAALAEAGDGLRQHFMLHVTPEGLVIEIVDARDAPLFPSGSAAASARLTALMGVIAPVLGRTANPLKIVGHTDSQPFAGPASDNWRLSADRANTARRLLAGAGLEAARIVEVAGRAATEPLVDDPEAAQNRRIALTLLRDRRALGVV